MRPKIDDFEEHVRKPVASFLIAISYNNNNHIANHDVILSSLLLKWQPKYTIDGVRLNLL